jgi:hypothetical protein
LEKQKAGRRRKGDGGVRVRQKAKNKDENISH